jgi:long-chain acyl-CoA synthetase
LLEAQIPPGLPLRLCISGAAPLPVETLNAFLQKFTIPLIEGYGLTEASPVVSMNPINGVRKPGSIGIPIPGVEVSVQSEIGEILPPGQIGEICVRGGNVMQGYWNQIEETNKALRDGWLLTGDVGCRDEDGYFYITDRKGHAAGQRNQCLSPRDRGSDLSISRVKEAAVISQADPRKGEHPVAFVAPNDNVTLDEKMLCTSSAETG